MEETASISSMAHKSTLLLASFCKTISGFENLLRQKGKCLKRRLSLKSILIASEAERARKRALFHVVVE